MISLPSYILMKNQLQVGTKADLSFNLRHFRPIKSFRRPRFLEKNGLFFQYFWHRTYIQITRRKFPIFSDFLFISQSCQLVKIFSDNFLFSAHLLWFLRRQFELFVPVSRKVPSVKSSRSNVYFLIYGIYLYLKSRLLKSNSKNAPIGCHCTVRFFSKINNS